MMKVDTYLIAAFVNDDDVGRQPTIRFLHNDKRLGRPRRNRRNMWMDRPDGYSAHKFQDVDGQLDKVLALVKRLKLTKELTAKGYKVVIYRYTITPIFNSTRREKRQIWPCSPLEALAQVAE